MNNRILLFQRIIPSYRVSIFKQLFYRFGIITCHSKERKKGKVKSAQEHIDYSNELIGRFYYQREEAAVVQNIFKPLLKYRPKIVISQFSFKYFTFWLLFILKPIFRYKLIVWTHGIQNKEREKPFITFRGRLSLFFYRNVDAIILYSNEIKDLFIAHRVTTKPIYVAKNTIDTYSLRDKLIALQQVNRDKLKLELGFTTKYSIVYIGRLLKSKNIDLLCRVFDSMPSTLDVSLHIIGDGEERDLVLQKSRQNKRIVYHGAVYDDSLNSKLLYCSDMLLMTGEVGLSIIHGFCFGLPLITVKGVSHGPEIDFLKDGINGFFVDADTNAIVMKISEILADDLKLQLLKQNALDSAYNECSVENFLNGFDEAINFFKT